MTCHARSYIIDNIPIMCWRHIGFELLIADFSYWGYYTGIIVKTVKISARLL